MPKQPCLTYVPAAFWSHQLWRITGLWQKPVQAFCDVDTWNRETGSDNTGPQPRILSDPTSFN